MPFSAKTLDFLFENRLHDSRIWFEEHKEEYQKQVLFPLQELVRQLTPHVLKIDSQFTTEPRVDRTICRTVSYTHLEIADMLELPLPTVLSKYSRALKKLKMLFMKGEQKG